VKQTDCFSPAAAGPIRVNFSAYGKDFPQKDILKISMRFEEFPYYSPKYCYFIKMPINNERIIDKRNGGST